MAHWAKVNKSGIVEQVLVTSNESPEEGYTWLKERLGGTWIKTSYNTSHGEHHDGGTPLRKNFASVGYKYDKNLDAFIPPKPFESWVLNEEIADWEAPVPRPGMDYDWDEETTSWVEVTEESE